MITKICTKCKKEKPLSEFYKDKSKRDGYYSSCKKCNDRKEYFDSRKHLKREYDKLYREKNILSIKQKAKKYYQKNKERIKQKSKNNYHLNKNTKKFKDGQKDYYEKNKEQIQQKHREYYQKNKEKIQNYLRNYKKERSKKDINFKFRYYLRSRIYNAIRKNIKSLSTLFLIGCEIDYLMYYLQSQFKPGMTWDNYGKQGWEVDHIKPCASFDLSKPEEQRKCFHYTNLQPLWAKENRKKSTKEN